MTIHVLESHHPPLSAHFLFLNQVLFPLIVAGQLNKQLLNALIEHVLIVLELLNLVFLHDKLFVLDVELVELYFLSADESVQLVLVGFLDLCEILFQLFAFFHLAHFS